MNTKEKQSSKYPANEMSKNQILNTEDDFLNPKDPEEEEDVDEEDLEEEAEYPVDIPGNDFNEIEEEDQEDEAQEEDENDDDDEEEDKNNVF